MCLPVGWVLLMVLVLPACIGWAVAYGLAKRRAEDEVKARQAIEQAERAGGGLV